MTQPFKMLLFNNCLPSQQALQFGVFYKMNHHAPYLHLKMQFKIQCIYLRILHVKPHVC